MGVPSKNSCDWIVPKDIRDEFSKGFPKEWVVKITALQERRVTRHTPKREGPIREKSSTLSKSSRISEKMEDSLYRGMSDKQKERARKLDRLRALQKRFRKFLNLIFASEALLTPHFVFRVEFPYLFSEFRNNI